MTASEPESRLNTRSTCYLQVQHCATFPLPPEAEYKKSLPFLSPGDPVFYRQLRQHCRGRQQFLRPAVSPPSQALAEKETKPEATLGGQGQQRCRAKYGLLPVSPRAKIQVVLLVLAGTYWSRFSQSELFHLSSSSCTHKVGRYRMQVGIYTLSNYTLRVHESPASSESFHVSSKAK